MKIIVEITPNEQTRRKELSVSDIDLTEEQWSQMSEEEKRVAIERHIDEYDQPYWVLESFIESFIE